MKQSKKSVGKKKKAFKNRTLSAQPLPKSKKLGDVIRPTSETNMRIEDDHLQRKLNFEQSVSIDFEKMISKYEKLSQMVALPTIDKQFYYKNYIINRTQENLIRLGDLNEALLVHKIKTVRVLKMIKERERVLQKLKKLCKQYNEGKKDVLKVQEKGLQLLEMLQQTGLSVVEHIVRWRESLTRPYAFNYKGKNYILKMLEDCIQLDNCEISFILPLKLSEKPLISDFTNLSALSAKITIELPDPITTPVGKQKQESKPSKASLEYQKRLRKAEEYILKEESMQEKLSEHLKSLRNEYIFLPILYTPMLSNCLEGIPIPEELKKGVDELIAKEAEEEKKLQRTRDVSLISKKSRTIREMEELDKQLQSALNDSIDDQSTVGIPKLDFHKRKSKENSIDIRTKQFEEAVAEVKKINARKKLKDPYSKTEVIPYRVNQETTDEKLQKPVKPDVKVTKRVSDSKEEISDQNPDDDLKEKKVHFKEEKTKKRPKSRGSARSSEKEKALSPKKEDIQPGEKQLQSPKPNQSPKHKDTENVDTKQAEDSSNQIPTQEKKEENPVQESKDATPAESNTAEENKEENTIKSPHKESTPQPEIKPDTSNEKESPKKAEEEVNEELEEDIDFDVDEKNLRAHPQTEIQEDFENV